jgi:hypothetical protein
MSSVCSSAINTCGCSINSSCLDDEPAWLADGHLSDNDERPWPADKHRWVDDEQSWPADQDLSVDE